MNYEAKQEARIASYQKEKAEKLERLKAQAQRIEELQASLDKLTKAFDNENVRACKAEAEVIAYSKKLGEEETRRREERDEAEAFAQRQADTIEALQEANQKLRGRLESKARTIEAQARQIEATNKAWDKQREATNKAQAEAQAFKELYNEAQARKERALIVARNRKAEALSLCRKLAQADQAQAQAEELNQAQADKIWNLEEELEKAELRNEEQAEALAGALAQAQYANELESQLSFTCKQAKAKAEELFQAQSIIVGMDEKLFKAEERERALIIEADQARKELDLAKAWEAKAKELEGIVIRKQAEAQARFEELSNIAQERESKIANLTIKYLEAQARSEAQARTIEELRKELAEARQAYLLGILPL